MSKSKSIVRKSNAFIEASYSMTLIEHRVVLACLAQVEPQKEITDEILYSVSVADIANQSERSINSSYNALKRAAYRLKRTEVKLPYGPSGEPLKKGFMLASIAQTIRYIDEEGRVEIRFNKDILPYISQLSQRYTEYSLKSVIKFSSPHAVRLYEHLSQWVLIGEKVFTLDSLKEKFSLSDKYKKNKDFKRWVIEPAVSQINEISDLSILVEYKKTGRKITHINFIIRKKETDLKGSPSSLRKIIEEQALPGESWDEARRRISKNKGVIDRSSNAKDMLEDA